MYAKNKLMRSAAVSLGLFTLAGASTAYAADAVMEQPPAPPAAPMEAAPVATWAGPYAGIVLGYGFNGSADGFGFDEDDFGVDTDTDGFIGGGFAGWQGQSGSFVYGVEGDVNYNGMSGSNIDSGYSADHSVDGSLRARLGFAATDNILIYGTGGGAAETLEVTDDLTGVSDDNTMLGYTVGAGVDAKLTENVFGRLEYRYTDYGSEEFANVGGDVEDSNHRVMVGVGMQF